MSVELRAFDCLIPAGTAKTAPVAVSLAMPPRIVDRIEVRVPPGSNGAVGFALGSGAQPVLPYNPGAFVVVDDDHFDWPVTGQISSGAWQLIGYNTGQYDHTVYVRFWLSLVNVGAAVPLPATPIEAVILGQAPTDTTDAGDLADTTVPDDTATGAGGELAADTGDATLQDLSDPMFTLASAP